MQRQVGAGPGSHQEDPLPGLKPEEGDGEPPLPAEPGYEVVQWSPEGIADAVPGGKIHGIRL
jgi:hypothetical protein